MMVNLHSLLIATAAVLLCGALTDAQGAISNFQVANRNSTHITFSWDIVDGLYSSRDINYFRIYYRQRSGYGGNSITRSIYISYSNTDLIGTSFQYTTTVTSFSIYGQYIMWVYAYKTNFNSSYSEQVYIEVGRQISIEVNVKLWPSQTCHEFTVQSTATSGAVENEVYWAIRKYCQCTYPYFRYFRLNNGYFTCAAEGYVTFRANLLSSIVTDNPADLKSTLTTWLHGQGTDKTITIYGMRYSVEPGPCGVTVPHLYAPACSTSASSSILTQANTTVIVASVFAAMFFILSLGLIGYILVARRSQTTHSTGAKVAS